MVTFITDQKSYIYLSTKNKRRKYFASVSEGQFGNAFHSLGREGSSIP